MAKQQIIEMLNKGRARELAVSLQYMRQHYVGEGLASPAILGIFKKIAVEEMKHAEAFGERIAYLGGEPTTKPDPIRKSETLKGMIEDDLKSEQEAVDLYRKAIALCAKEKDVVSRRLFEDILAAEEEHVDEFQTLLGKKGEG